MVQIELRDYQEDIIVRSRAALARHKSALIVLPTGGGKTLADLKVIQVARGYKPAWVHKMAKVKRIKT